MENMMMVVVVMMMVIDIHRNAGGDRPDGSIVAD